MSAPIRPARLSFDQLPPPLLAELSAAGLDAREVYDAVVRAVAEDLPGDDVTSWATIPADQVETADFVARGDGVVAGLAVAELVFRHVLGEVDVRRPVPDGTAVHRGDVLLTVTGPTALLLTAERTALNFACHLSGVATATHGWVQVLSATGSTRVRDTRKTLPGLRHLEKYAVRTGGGVNHRTDLSEMALIKDNHVLAAGGVVPAWEKVRAAYPDVPVQVEVTTLDQLRELLAVGADEILLDNMDDATMTEAVAITAGRARLEASGGLTLGRAPDVAATGVDFVAVGALTHSAPVLDIAMDLRPSPGARRS
jgi:nicotinate-nucleotide pyrophosphorylase (carboxylating)